MKTLFFDIVNDKNVDSLDMLNEDVENLLIYNITTVKKITNLPIELKKIIIYDYCLTFLMNGETITMTSDFCVNFYGTSMQINKIEYFLNNVFTKLPMGCELILLDKNVADIVYWTNSENIKTQYYFDARSLPKSIEEYSLSDYYFRHLLFKIPDFIDVNKILFYDSVFLLLTHKFEYSVHVINKTNYLEFKIKEQVYNIFPKFEGENLFSLLVI